MNILYRGCESREGFQSKVLNTLYQKGIFSKCTIVSQTADGQDDYSADIYHEIPAYIGYECKYNEICDFNTLPAISEDILIGMKQYESTALDMNSRNYHMHICNFNEMEEEYLAHVTFWNYLLDNEHIEFIFLCTVPHHMWEYIIYALAKVKKIPVLMVSIANVLNLSEVGTSIENLGSNAANLFAQKKICALGKEMESYYNCVKYEKNYLPQKERNKRRKENEKWAFRTYYKKMISVVGYKSRAILKDIITFNFKKLKIDFNIFYSNYEYLMRILSHKRKLKGIKYYNRHLAQKVDLNTKYIYFALQYVPESSVLPRGGVFSNQLISIRILAQAAEQRGIKVYVKEHYLEYAREKRFYEELKDMPNVYLLSTSEDTYEIIDNALAVSSQTGTCMQEAIIRGIPVITFGNHCLCGAPGVFRVGNIEETEKVLDTIDNSEYHISSDEVKLYFGVLEKTLVKSFCEWSCGHVFPINDYIDETVELIERFVCSGMKEDFYYYKE